MSENRSKNKTQAFIMNAVSALLGLIIAGIIIKNETGLLPLVLAITGIIVAIVNLFKLKNRDIGAGRNLIALVCVIAAASLFTLNAGSKKEAVSAQEIKEVMPAELKDSALLQKEEESALDKLNSIIDTSNTGK